MSVKIDAKIIGIKAPIVVKTTNKNMRLVVKANKALANASDPVEKTDLQTLGALEDALTVPYECIVNILKLTKTQANKLDELEFDEVIEFMGRISNAILNNEDDDGKAIDTADSKK